MKKGVLSESNRSTTAAPPNAGAQPVKHPPHRPREMLVASLSLVIKCLENRVTVLENQNKALIEELKSLKELYTGGKYRIK